MKFNLENFNNNSERVNIDVSKYVFENYGINFDALDITQKQVITDYVQTNASSAVMNMIKSAQADQLDTQEG